MRDLTPKPYQGMATDFFASVLRGNLFADPGLGKTLVVLMLIDLLGLEDVLIVAPWLVVRETWAKEPQKWRQLSHLACVPIIGTEEERDLKLTFLPRISVVNYEQLIWLYRRFNKKNWPFKHVFFDESTRLAGYRTRKGTRRANALAQNAWPDGTTAPAVQDPTHHKPVIERWVNLSGTPNANGYDKLWGPQWFVDGGKALGLTYGDMLERWFYKKANRRGWFGKPLLLPGAEREITSRMAATTFTVRAKDYFKFDDPIERVITVDLPPAVREQYRQMERNFYTRILEGEINAANCGVKSIKLRQLASGAVYYDEEQHYGVVHTERLDALESIVMERSGYNLLVVYQFRHELALIKGRFKEAVDIHDSNAVERWNRGEIPMLLAHPRSAGHGLDLQHGGHVLVAYSPFSDAELWDQVLARIGPIRQLQSGYDRPVYVDHIEARDTVDDKVTRPARVRRIDEMDAFLDAMTLEGLV